MIELISRPFVVSCRRGANLFVASLLLGISFFLATASTRAQGGTDTAPADTAAVPFDTLGAYPELEDWRLGVYFGVNLNRYGADNMRGLPDVPTCCPAYNSGGGVGMAIGGLMEMPLSGRVAIGTRLYLETYNGALVAEESQTVAAGGFAETAVFQHRIDADIWAVAIEPVVVVDLGGEFKLFGGVRGDVIARKRYRQEERLIASEGIRFENDLTTRMQFEGQIPQQTSMHGSILAGARYDIALGENGEFVISPEVSFWYGLTPVVSDGSWKIHGLRFAVSGQFLRFPSFDDYDDEAYEDEWGVDPATKYGPVELPVSDEKEGGRNPGTGSGG